MVVIASVYLVLHVPALCRIGDYRFEEWCAKVQKARARHMFELLFPKVEEIKHFKKYVLYPNSCMFI
jgi:hypothetical protein